MPMSRVMAFTVYPSNSDYAPFAISADNHSFVTHEVEGVVVEHGFAFFAGEDIVAYFPSHELTGFVKQ